MRRRQFVFAVSALISLEVLAKDEAPYSGIWELNVPYIEGSQGNSKIVMMKQVGDSLRLKDLETGQEYAGHVSGGGIAFSLWVKGHGSQQAVVGSFTGALGQGGLKGNTTF